MSVRYVSGNALRWSESLKTLEQTVEKLLKSDSNDLWPSVPVHIENCLNQTSNSPIRKKNLRQTWDKIEKCLVNHCGVGVPSLLCQLIKYKPLIACRVIEEINPAAVNPVKSVDETPLHVAAEKAEVAVVNALLKKKVDVLALAWIVPPASQADKTPPNSDLEMEETDLPPYEIIINEDYFEDSGSVDSGQEEEINNLNVYSALGSCIYGALNAKEPKKEERGEIFSMLLESGVDPNIGTTGRSRIPILSACIAFNTVWACEIWLQSTFLQKDFLGKTPLHYAVVGQQLGILESLVEEDGVEVNGYCKQTPFDQIEVTAVHLAIDNPEILKLLIQNGGNPHLKSRLAPPGFRNPPPRLSAFMMAVKQNLTKSIRLILKYAPPKPEQLVIEEDPELSKKLQETVLNFQKKTQPPGTGQKKQDSPQSRLVCSDSERR